MLSTMHLNVITLFGLVCLVSVAYGQDNVITAKEKADIAKIKEKAADLVKIKYFQEEFVLAHYLRAHDNNIDTVVEKMRETAQWRKDNKISQIHNEKILEDLYPSQYIGVDKAGRPLILMGLSKWDVRKIILAGQRKKLTLKWSQIMENSHRRLLQERAKGNDVTQVHSFIDLDRYNLQQHACVQCFAEYFEWVRILESHYPHFVSHLRYINTPRIFIPLLELLKPLFSTNTRKALTVHGKDKAEWTKDVLKTIDASELLEIYGGTRKS